MPLLYQLMAIIPPCCGVPSHYILLPFVLIVTGASFSLPEVIFSLLRLSSLFDGEMLSDFVE